MWRALLLFILAVLLVRAVLRLVGGIVSGVISAGPVTTGGNQPAAPPAVKMERDPVCGTYVVPSKAIALAKGRETLYFCSERCRDEWVHAH